MDISPIDMTENGHSFVIETYYTDRCMTCQTLRSVLDKPGTTDICPLPAVR